MKDYLIVLKGNRYFQVVNDDDLIGYFCVEPLSAERVEIGLGLKPDLTGQGLGMSFLKMIESFILKQHKYQTLTCLIIGISNHLLYNSK